MQTLVNLHNQFFQKLESSTRGWFLGMLARFIFAATLAGYFLNSAFTKFDGGPFSISDSAYFQILPPVVEAAGFDTSQIAFFPWGLIVMLGSYGEIILPILIIIGLFTRIAAFGMIVFIFVQSYVDIAFHGVDAATIGAWFDNLSDSAILDQRSLWMFLLVFLVIAGAGKVSLDYLLVRRFKHSN